MTVDERFESTQAAYAEAEFNIARRLAAMTRFDTDPCVDSYQDLAKLVQVAVLLQTLQFDEVRDEADDTVYVAGPGAMRWAAEDEAE